MIGGVDTVLDPSFQVTLPFETDSVAPPLLRRIPSSLSGRKYTDTCTESESLNSSDSWYCAVELPWKRNATSICIEQQWHQLYQHTHTQLTDSAACLASNNWFFKPAISSLAASTFSESAVRS